MPESVVSVAHARPAAPHAVPAVRGRGPLRTAAWFACHRPVLAASYLVVALTVLVALLGPLLEPADPIQQSADVLFAPGSSGHLLGTDYLGRDQFSRILAGARPVLLIALAAVGASGLVGVAVGLLAGYRRGWLEAILLRSMDAILSFPLMLLGIMMVAALGSGSANLVLVIAVGLTPLFGRLAHALALQEAGRDYVLAARAAGMRPLRIMLSEITPNLLGPVLVQATSLFSAAVGFSTALSYLGLGVQAPTADWGLMVKEGQPYISNAADLAVIPGVLITVLLVAVTFVGDDLRDRLDPQGRLGVGRTG